MAQQALIQKLVLRLGPETAQDEIYRSGLPFTGETHLVIHTVGSLIYEKFGSNGVSRCRPHFLGACYHGFLIAAVAEHGPKSISDAWQQCREGGPEVTRQCAHGAGHGLLIWNNYSIPEALQACDSMAGISDFASFNCYDGVFMENVWGAHGHDHGHLAARTADIQTNRRSNHLVSHSLADAKDLDYPCNDNRIKMKYLPACWGNQVSILYEAFHGDLAKIAQKCFSLPEVANKEFCLNGLARQIQPLTGGSADEAFRLCAMASTGQWKQDCLIINAEAAFALGDRSNAPFQICRRLEGATRDACYQKLSSLITLYANGDLSRIERICADIAERNYLDSCASSARSSERPELSHAIRPANEQHFFVETRSQLASSPTLEARKSFPYSTPYSTPYPTPYETPYPTPYETPYPTPYETPYPSPTSR
ncbi:hypothetical protein [Methylocystis rosea]|uniref:hypothetical protein n=1 Tax=Methylocystis rosea TaxID=173366 RepID=UPI00039FB551|nr:hypothetical protein [Methylocystis rosea]